MTVDHEALRDAAPTPYWLDQPDRPDPRDRRTTRHGTADLCVVGGGYSGLWTAILAKERDPSRDVVLLEGDRIGWAASGRNGGFCAASLTHGQANGAERFARRDRHASSGSAGRTSTRSRRRSTRYGIDCDFERPGALTVATEPHQVAWLRDGSRTVTGRRSSTRTRCAPRSPRRPTCAGALEPRRHGPGRPGQAGLGAGRAPPSRSACASTRARTVTGSRAGGAGLDVRTAPVAVVRARQVALGHQRVPVAGAPRCGSHTVPVYDYALMTEPLSTQQLASIGWRDRQGIDDMANQFHYYRLTADNRILWGGYDAIYHFGGTVRPSYDQRPETFDLLARQFFETFPQLEGLRFTHRWGGAIDTCTRFCAFFGTAYGGRAAYAARLHRARRRRDPVRRRRDARPARRASTPSAPDSSWCERSRCRSRPSRSPGPASSSPARRSPRPTATRGDATSGCAPSTGSGSASTPDHAACAPRRVPVTNRSRAHGRRHDPNQVRARFIRSAFCVADP